MLRDDRVATPCHACDVVAAASSPRRCGRRRLRGEAATRRRVATIAATAAPATRPSDPKRTSRSTRSSRGRARRRARRRRSPPTRAPLDALALFAEARDAMLAATSGSPRSTCSRRRSRSTRTATSCATRSGRRTRRAGMANEQSIAAYEAAAAIDPDHLDRPVRARPAVPGQERARRRRSSTCGWRVQTTEYARRRQPRRRRRFLPRPRAAADGLRPRGAGGVREAARPAADRRAARARRARSWRTSSRSPEALYVQVGELLRAARPATTTRVELYELAAERKPERLRAAGARSCGRWPRRGGATRRRARGGRRRAHVPRQPDVARAAQRDLPARSAATRPSPRELHAPAPRAARTTARCSTRWSTCSPRRASTSEAERAARRRGAAGALRDASSSAGCSSSTTSATTSTRAARLLIEALAARPDNTRELTPLWSQLLRPWRRNHAARRAARRRSKSRRRRQASKLFWLSQLAQMLEPRRAGADRRSSRRSSRSPPFAPAYRALLGAVLVARRLGRAAQERGVDGADRVGRAAGRRGPRRRAARARCCCNAGRPPRRVDAVRRGAGAAATTSPDLRLALRRGPARAGRRRPRPSRSCGSSSATSPTCEEAYLQLFRSYLQRRAAAAGAIEVLQDLARDRPGQRQRAACSRRRVFLAGERSRRGRADAQRAVRPRAGQRRGARAHARRSTRRPAGSTSTSPSSRRSAPSTRRTARPSSSSSSSTRTRSDRPRRRACSTPPAPPSASDPDLLYYIAHLYTRIEQKETTEQMLAAGRRARSRRTPPASNDLGYTWADAGQEPRPRRGADPRRGRGRAGQPVVPRQPRLGALQARQVRRGAASSSRTPIDAGELPRPGRARPPRRHALPPRRQRRRRRRSGSARRSASARRRTPRRPRRPQAASATIAAEAQAGRGRPAGQRRAGRRTSAAQQAKN